ncbi:hypothetical protein DMJ13_00845 [halophilic archaeon]|nr:hypothetical protein DMJ13_00845 [halophilic archaeon]
MERNARLLAGALAGSALAAAVHVLVLADVGVTVSLAFVWSVGVALALRLHRYTAGPNSFRVGRWSGLGTLVMTVPALVGLVGVPVDLRLALGLLLVGTGFAGVQVGVATMVEREEGTVSSGERDAKRDAVSESDGSGKTK